MAQRRPRPTRRFRIGRSCARVGIRLSDIDLSNVDYIRQPGHDSRRQPTR